MKSQISRLLLCIGLTCFAIEIQAQYTDVIILENGDRITGEVKGLMSGQLELKTEYMGTVYINWEDIYDLVSNEGLQIELQNGERLVGSLDKPKTKDAQWRTISVASAPMCLSGSAWNLRTVECISGKYPWRGQYQRCVLQWVGVQSLQGIHKMRVLCVGGSQCGIHGSEVDQRGFDNWGAMLVGNVLLVT